MLSYFTRTSAWGLYLAIMALYGFSLWALFAYRAESSAWSLAETWRIVQHSVGQAFLSAALTTIFGLLTARSFFYLSFKGKSLLYKLIAFAWALPSLVVIFALIGVWGNHGWLAQLLAFFDIEWQFSLYGLHGIVLAHLFLNIPLMMKYVLEGLNLIPSHQHQLAAQLALKGWDYFRIVEFPVLKGILPYAFMTVFLLCFTSFPIVLMLGGSPKYSTLEVAIYQAVTFEFDFAKAIKLIVVQMVIGLLLQLFMDLATRNAFEKTKQKKVSVEIWRSNLNGVPAVWAGSLIFLVALLIILPMLSVVWHGVTALNAERLASPELWNALLFSLLMSLISSFSVIAMAYLIALETRRLAYDRKTKLQRLLAGVTTYPLILPIFLLAVGLFLLFMDIELQVWQLLLLVGVCNGLTLLPFIYRLIFSAVWQALISHDKLARSLGLSGFKRWWIVEKNQLIRPLAQAFALSMSAGLGSFSVIAFFGSPDFSTLPYLLYQQLGSYRTEEAAVTALLFMLCALLPFLFISQKENL